MEHFISDDEARRRHEALRSLARHLVASAEDAEDAVQDTWLARLNQAHEPIHNHEGWLRRVLRRKVGLQHRQRTSRAEHERRAARPEAQPPEESVVHSDLAATLNAALDNLREPYRTVLRLRYIEQLSERGICEALDRPLTTVKSQISRGLALLRRGLDGRFGQDRSSWTGLFLGFFLGVRGVARGTAPVLAVVIGGLAALQLAVAVAVDVDGGGQPARSAAPGPAAAVAVQRGLAPGPGLASEAALVPLSAPEHTATQLPLLGDETESLSHEQRIATPGHPRVTSEPGAVSAAAPGPRVRRARVTHPSQRAPRLRADNSRPLHLGGRARRREAEASQAMRTPQRRRNSSLSKGRSRKQKPPGPEGTPPVSGKAGQGLFGGSGGPPPDEEPPVGPYEPGRMQSLGDQLRFAVGSRR